MEIKTVITLDNVWILYLETALLHAVYELV